MDKTTAKTYKTISGADDSASRPEMMDSVFKTLRLLFLFAALILGQTGCATTKETYDDTTTSGDSDQSREDSTHGWGANLSGAGR
jgi:hypothetical protein